MSRSDFQVEKIPGLAVTLGNEILRAYEATVPIPQGKAASLEIGKIGCGEEGLPDIWRSIVDLSAHPGSPLMSGHMDTAPHPAAALTQSLVAALNNNLLFRELSPLGSPVEEYLIDFMKSRLNLGSDWNGLFASGGSLANLTALFTALGGYSPTSDRAGFHLFLPSSGHVSLTKAAAVLGIPANQVHKVQCDDAGRMDPDQLRQDLNELPASARAIVCAVAGTTIHGSVDNIAEIARISSQRGAWLHIDAIYGGALCFSHEYRSFLEGLECANSIVLGPQKWMYVPRVSAICLVKGGDLFDSALSVQVPYSLGSDQHRGRWGLQGSRPADALVLWAALKVMGTERLGHIIDRSIRLTKVFHERLEAADDMSPTHSPDLNLQVFRVGGPDRDGSRLSRIQKNLVERGRSWFSVSRWRDETVMRAVLLSPDLTEGHLDDFLADLRHAANN
jgi:glutamate/tyrosine decarboxylase-like PLP-dependent enzyme